MPLVVALVVAALLGTPVATTPANAQPRPAATNQQTGKKIAKPAATKTGDTKAGDTTAATEATASATDETVERIAIAPEEVRRLAGAAGELAGAVRVQQRATRSSRAQTVEEALRQVQAPRTPANIYRWIRDHIDYEPYAGALRGVSGALAAGSANAVDQALLLAAMYEQAGFRTRFVTGTLHAHDVAVLLQNYAGSARLAASGDGSVLEGLSLDDAGAGERYARLVPQHVWVEVEDGGRFVAADPILGPLYGSTPAVAQSRSAELPEAFVTTMEIQLVARLQDTQEIALLTVAGPLGNYAYRALSLGFVPDATRADVLRPVLSLDGQATRGQPLPRAQLAELELRYAMRVGRRQTRWTQTLYKRGVGVDIFAFDTQHLAIGVLPGWTSNDQVARVGIRSVGRAAERVERWAEARRKGEPETREAFDATLNELHADLGPVLPFAFMRTLDRLTFELADIMGVRPILQSPRVVTTAILRRGERYFVALDVRGDSLEALPMQGIPPVASTGFATLYGRMKNQLEGAFVETVTGQRAMTVDTVFRHARTARTPFATIHAGSLDLLELVEADAHSLDAIRTLAGRQGMIVLIPSKRVRVADADHFAWWALHPLTGILRGDTQDALLAMQAARADNTSRAAAAPDAAARALASALRLGDQMLAAVARSLEPSAEYRGVMCEARADLETIGRALCATSTAHALPSLEQCLQKQGAPGHDLLSFSVPTCESQVMQTRCGAVVASALLTGRLAVRPTAAVETEDGAAVAPKTTAYCR